MEHHFVVISEPEVPLFLNGEGMFSPFPMNSQTLSSWNHPWTFLFPDWWLPMPPGGSLGNVLNQAAAVGVISLSQSCWAVPGTLCTGWHPGPKSMCDILSHRWVPGPCCQDLLMSPRAVLVGFISCLVSLIELSLGPGAGGSLSGWPCAGLQRPSCWWMEGGGGALLLCVVWVLWPTCLRAHFPRKTPIACLCEQTPELEWLPSFIQQIFREDLLHTRSSARS